MTVCADFFNVLQVTKDVDARDKPGHDDYGR
jgi:hypothetical protein